MRLVEEFLADLTKELQSRKDSLTRGSAADYADYRYQCGVIKGLEASGSMLVEFFKSKPREERN